MSQAKTLKSESVDVDGITFETTQFAAFRGFKLMAKLVKQVGPAMGALTGVDPNTDLKELAPVLVEALSVLNPDEAGLLLLEILAGTTAIIDGKHVAFLGKTAQSNFDMVFNGRLGCMFKVLGHALTTHFADFSEGLPSSASSPADAQ